MRGDLSFKFMIQQAMNGLRREQYGRIYAEQASIQYQI
jgi:hypothetical protein